MSNPDISITPTSSAVLNIQPGGAAASITFQVKWSEPDGSIHSIPITFGASLPEGVSATFSPAKLSLTPAGGSASITATLHAAKNAPSTHGPAYSSISLNIPGTPARGSLGFNFYLTVGASVPLAQYEVSFTGNLIISNGAFNVADTPVPAFVDPPLSETWQFVFSQIPGPQGPTSTYSVSVTAAPLSLMVNADGGDTITATPSSIGGTYDSSTGLLDLTVALAVSDTRQFVGSAASPQPFQFDFSTSPLRIITAAQTGQNATGSPLTLDVAGLATMTLVGSGPLQVNPGFPFSSTDATLGFSMTGQLSPSGLPALPFTP